MSHIVFVSLFLGLVSGVQPVELRVDQDVKSVRLLLSGKEIATFHHAPWRAEVDFGTVVEPRELVAVAYDKDGEEIDRTLQILNLPRPIAEAQILLHHDKGFPSSVEVVARHLQFLKPAKAVIHLDGVPLAVRGMTAALPAADWLRSHVISAELHFDDGSVARSEIVVNGGFSDSTGAQLSPVIVNGGAQKSANLAGCFTADGVALRASAVEKTKALVAFVREPDPREWTTAVNVMQREMRISPLVRQMLVRDTTLSDATERIIWPIAKQFSSPNEGTSVLFEHSNDMDPKQTDLFRLLTISMWSMPHADAPRQFADAVAVAGLQMMMPARRRAIVLVLSEVPDRSAHTPEQVRHYLESIHVPLFVWSFASRVPDWAQVWGPVDDVSHSDGLRAAMQKVQAAIDDQQIAWVATDPVTALRVKVDAKCGFAPLRKL